MGLFLPPVVFIIAILYIQDVWSSPSCPSHVLNKRNTYTAVHNNTCYLFVNQEMYWSKARNACWDMGGEMLSIENKETMDFIRKQLDSDELKWDREGVWLGARHRSGTWRWTDGRKMGYSNWASGEPSMILGFLSIEDCSLMRDDDDWKWHDYPCGSLKFHYNYVCEFPAVEIETTTATTSSHVSPPDTDSIAEARLEWESEFYKRLGQKVYQIINVNGTPSTLQILQLRQQINEAALSKPEDKPGRTSPSAANQEEDNGHTAILTIIIVLGCGFLLLIFVIFLLIHRHNKRVKQKNYVTTVHYTNDPHSLPAASRADQTLPPVPSSRVPAINDDLYLAPKEVTDMYTEVSKPSNLAHINKTCRCGSVQSGASNSVCSSPGTSSSLGACGGSDPEQDARTPLMPQGAVVGTDNSSGGPKGSQCSCSQGDYVDMNSLNSVKEDAKTKDEEKHTYTNVDHRDVSVENHYEVLP